MAPAGEAKLTDRMIALADVRAHPTALAAPASSLVLAKRHCTSNRSHLHPYTLQVKVDDVQAVYTLGDELGRGRFSVVQAAMHKIEKKRYAIKVVENETLSDEENLEAAAPHSAWRCIVHRALSSTA